MKKMKTSRTWMWIALMMILVLVAGCASPQTPTAAPQEPTAPAVEAPKTPEESEVPEATEEVVSEPPAEVKPPEGVEQVLRINFRIPAGGVDPVVEQADAGFQMMSAVYDRLVVVNSKMELVPQLADSWDVSPDAKTWTFHLHPGVKFHDGTTLDAEAVKHSISRVLDPANASLYASTLTMVDSIEVIDPLTVRFNLSYPFAAFVRSLALPGAMITCPQEVEKWGKDFVQHGCGSGPFYIDKFVPGEGMEVVRFDDYWRGPAKLDRIVYTFISDEQARVSALIAGDTDFETNIPGPMLPLVESNPDLTIERGPAMMVEYIGFNTTDPIFSDKLVRQAVAYSIDMETLIKNVMGGVGVHASQPISPLAFGYDPSLKPIPYDPAKATELLKQAGWSDTNGDKVMDKNGESLTTKFCIMSIPQMVQFAQGVQAYMRDVGIDAQIESLDWGTYLDAAQSGNCPIFEIGEGANTGDADYILWSQFHSSMIPASNWTRYNSRTYDELMVQQRQEVDPDKRLELLNQSVRLLMEDMPWVPTWVRENLQAHKSYVKGYVQGPSTTYMDLYPVYIGK
ncbi:MAG: hypothetical protein IT316_06610 [Anaerolineales bacterium]|nr:hypothetical protein [Anaerolineales bacterium]